MSPFYLLPTTESPMRPYPVLRSPAHTSGCPAPPIALPAWVRERAPLAAESRCPRALRAEFDRFRDHALACFDALEVQAHVLPLCGVYRRAAQPPATDPHQ